MKDKAKHKLIHVISGAINQHFMANAILAVGARPMMAQEEIEMQEVASKNDALVLNLSTLLVQRKKAMLLAAKIASQRNIPIILDCVGVGASRFRKECAWELIKESHAPFLIKGNSSEIRAMIEEDYYIGGVDAKDEDSIIKKREEEIIALYKKTKALIVSTGEVDMLFDGKKMVYLSNGTPELSYITGTGCVAGALLGCYYDGSIDSAIYVISRLNIAAELAEEDLNEHWGNFQSSLLTWLRRIDDEQIYQRRRQDEQSIFYNR